MSGIIRSWQCLNARCAKDFTSWEPNPECPACKCVRVEWIPGGGHVAGTARAADAELRTLADNFGLTNINSARRDERSKPIAAPSNVAQNRQSAMQFAPGFAAVPDMSRAACVPSLANVNYKVKAGAGMPLGPGKLGLSSIQSATSVEARHKP